MLSILLCSSTVVMHLFECYHIRWKNIKPKCFLQTNDFYPSHLNIQDMKLHSHVSFVLRVHFDAVDVAEVGQQRHQVGFGVDDVTDAVARPDQQSHLCAFLSLLSDHKYSAVKQLLQTPSDFSSWSSCTKTIYLHYYFVLHNRGEYMLMWNL